MADGHSFEVLERELEELRPLKAENKSLQMQLQECRESRLTIGEENLKKEKESMSTIRRLENELMELRMMQATKKQVGFSLCVILSFMLMFHANFSVCRQWYRSRLFKPTVTCPGRNRSRTPSIWLSWQKLMYFDQIIRDSKKMSFI